MGVTIDEFKNMDLRVGTVLSAEYVPDSDKLLRLEVDFDEDMPRQILSGVAQFLKPTELVGRQLLFIVNLEPRVIRGLVSSGMLLATGEGEELALIAPTKQVPPGSRLR
jgi:methionyl-tRNA synthetase